MSSGYALATPHGHVKDVLGDRRSDRHLRPHGGECSTAPRLSLQMHQLWDDDPQALPRYEDGTSGRP
jgi:hypothetical protein